MTSVRESYRIQENRSSFRVRIASGVIPARPLTCCVRQLSQRKYWKSWDKQKRQRSLTGV
jgi:hypothetical protein